MKPKGGYKHHTKDNEINNVIRDTTNNNADVWMWVPYALKKRILLEFWLRIRFLKYILVI